MQGSEHCFSIIAAGSWNLKTSKSRLTHASPERLRLQHTCANCKDAQQDTLFRSESGLMRLFFWTERIPPGKVHSDQRDHTHPCQDFQVQSNCFTSPPRRPPSQNQTQGFLLGPAPRKGTPRRNETTLRPAHQLETRTPHGSSTQVPTCCAAWDACAEHARTRRTISSNFIFQASPVSHAVVAERCIFLVAHREVSRLTVLPV